MTATNTPTATDTPKVSITIPKPAAAEGEHRVAVRAALLGAIVLGKKE